MGPIPWGVFHWSRSEAIFANAASLTNKAELLVAEKEGSLVGCVVYVAPGREREAIYDSKWSIIRLLSVDPAVRGEGIGRQLSEACIEHARRDGAKFIALHTSPVMTLRFLCKSALGICTLSGHSG